MVSPAKSLLRLRGVLFCLGLIAGNGVNASPELEQALVRSASVLPLGSRLSVTLSRADGSRLLSKDSQQLVAPASTMKLLTAVAAWHALGADFRFQTRLVSLAGGDYAIIFSGDPFFDRDHLRAMLRAAAARGVSVIEGDLLLDRSIFTGHDMSGAQSWNDLNICFAAPASAISLNHNCVQGNLSGTAIGSPLRIYIAEHEPLRFVNETRVVGREDAQSRLCEVELAHLSNNRYRITGCSAPRKHALPLSIAVNDPVQYMRESLLAELRDANIQLRGGIHVSDRPVGGRLVVGHQSAPLAEMMEEMLQKSDNQLADVLFRTMGYQHLNADLRDGHYPATFRAGREAVRAQLTALGVDPGNALIADGSGLSRHNLLSADILDQALTQMSMVKDARLVAALPVSGESGSLKYRRGLLNPPLRGSVMAKTGSLTGVYNLAGFIRTESGEILQLVILVDGFNLAPELAKEVARHPGRHPIKLFYERFLGEVFNLPAHLVKVAQDS